MPEAPLEARGKAAVGVLRKALAKLPDSRFQSAQEMIEALREKLPRNVTPKLKVYEPAQEKVETPAAPTLPRRDAESTNKEPSVLILAVPAIVLVMGMTYYTTNQQTLTAPSAASVQRTAAPTQATSPVEGWLSATVEPPTATLTINGQAFGDKRLFLFLEGQHLTVVASAEGYVPQAQQVVVKKGRATSLSFQLLRVAPSSVDVPATESTIERRSGTNHALDPRRADFRSLATLSAMGLSVIDTKPIGPADVRAQVAKANDALDKANVVLETAVDNAIKGYAASVSAKKSASALLGFSSDPPYRGELDLRRLPAGYGAESFLEQNRLCGIFGYFSFSKAHGGGYVAEAKGPRVGVQDQDISAPRFLAANVQPGRVDRIFAPQGASVWVFEGKNCAAEVDVPRGLVGGTGWAVCRYLDGMVFAGQIRVRPTKVDTCTGDEFTIEPDGLGAMFATAFVASGKWSRGAIVEMKEIKLTAP